MSTSIAARHARMFEYERWCTPRVIDSLRRAEQHVKQAGLASLAPPLGRAIEIFGHAQAAKRLWLSRVSTLAQFPSDGLFPVWPLERSEQEAMEVDSLWGSFVGGLDDAAAERVVQYTSTEGKPYESVLSDILSHVVNHATYHRGQIAMLVAQTGTKPTSTDLIAMVAKSRAG